MSSSSSAEWPRRIRPPSVRVAGGSSATAASSSAASGSRPRSPARGRPEQRRGPGLQHLGQRRQRQQRAAERPQVAGVPLAQGEAGDQPLHVGHRLEGPGQVAAHHRGGEELLHRVEPRLDGRHLGQRVAQPLGQQPGARGGHRPVQLAEQGPLLPAALQGPLDLQVGPGGLVDEQHALGGQPRDPVDVAGRRPLGLGEVAERRRRGRKAEPHPRHAEAVERRDAEVAPEPLLAPLELGVVAQDEGRAGGRRHRLDPVGRGGAREEQLAGPGPAQLVDEARLRVDLAAAELAGGGLQQRQAAAALAEGDGGQADGLARLDGLVVEDRPRGDDPGDVALHQRALAGLLDLVADGDLEPLGQQPRHVAARGVVGDAAHGDLVVPLGAGGQRDLQGP